MNAKELSDYILGCIAARSGFEPRRDYVGMSKVGQCPRKTFFEVRDGTEPTLDLHMGAWLGYRLETCLLADLMAEGYGVGAMITPGRELVAFGGRVKGHTDAGLVLPGISQLIDIKSVTSEKLATIRRERRLPNAHWEQVQTYMHFGRYSSSLVVYLPRDCGLPWVTEVRYMEDVGARCERKLARILSALDRDVPPDCECWQCPSAREGYLTRRSCGA